MLIKINKTYFEVNKVIYVSPNGSNTYGNGTLLSPYKTLGKTLETALDNDAIFFMSGTHYFKDAELYGSKSPSSLDGLFTDYGKKLIFYSDILTTKIIVNLTKPNPVSRDRKSVV